MLAAAALQAQRQQQNRSHPSADGRAWHEQQPAGGGAGGGAGGWRRPAAVALVAAAVAVAAVAAAAAAVAAVMTRRDQRETSMLFGEIISVALGALRANKLRSLLTMLGIVIGVAAVIAMVALGTGAQSAVKDRISSLGTTLLTVKPGQQRGMGVVASDQSMKLTMDDAAAHRGARADTSPPCSRR